MFGEPAKPYTSTNKPHCLRSVVGDHAGANMFVMHQRSRDSGEITDETAVKWWQHMDRALVEDLRPVWKAKYGGELGHTVEKSFRWFTDHVLEKMVCLGIAHQINVHHTKRYVSSVHTNDQTVCDKQSLNGDEHDTDYHGNSIAKGCRKHAQAGLTLWDEFWIMKTNVIIKIRNKCV